MPPHYLSLHLCPLLTTALVHADGVWGGAGEEQGHAVATLCNLAHEASATNSLSNDMHAINGFEPLRELAMGPPTWLRAQAVDILKSLGQTVEVSGIWAHTWCRPYSPRRL